MLIIRNRPYSIMVLFAIALHLWWFLMIAIDVSALHATGLAALYRYIHYPMLLMGTVGAAAVMAFVGLSTRSPWSALLLLPQQALLMMSAAGAIEAIWLSQFADGVIRPRPFIAADQMYSVLAAIGHTAAIVAHATRKWIPVDE